MKSLLLPLTFLLSINIGSFAYEEALLLDAKSKKLNVNNLIFNKSYLFFYPYRATPALLIKTEDADSDTGYKISAYLAISPINYSYPSKDLSVVSIYSGEAQLGKDIIRFCDMKTSYNLFDGSYIINSEINTTKYSALTKVHISERANGELIATGISDTNVMKQFFRVNRRSIEKSHGNFKNAKKEYHRRTVRAIEGYSAITAVCNNIILPKSDINEDGLKIEEEAEYFFLLDE